MESERPSGPRLADDAPHGRTDGEGPEWAQWLAALVLFALAVASVFGALRGHDLREFTVANVVVESAFGEGKEAWDTLGANDLRFVTWQIARNARVLVTRPASLFDSEMCYPAERAMTYGESAIALGVVGIPAYWITGDPVFTYTFVTVVISLAGAIGMLLLIREWTGVAAAGIAAGLMYAFHEVKLGDVIHLYVWDNAWTIFALYFATRLFRTGRFAPAVGLWLAILMQVGGSMYPLIAAALLALPLLVWLFASHGIGRQKVGPWLFLAVSTAATVVLLLGPYFVQRSAGGIEATVFNFFRPLEWLLPGAGGFPGWVMLALIVAAFALGRRRCMGEGRGDPRWAMLVAVVVIFGLSVVGGGGTLEPVVAIERGQPSPSGLPNLYMTISRFVPGFEVGRSPGAMYTGVHLLLCVLAGIGAAGVVRAVPSRYALPVAAALVVLAYVDTVRPASLGLEPRVELDEVRVRPADDDLEFFVRLAELGNRGPILELPMIKLNFERASHSILNSAYHERPIAHCYNSFFPPETDAVEELSAVLPQPAALAALRRMGFTTIIVHHPPGDPFLERRRRKFERFEEGPYGVLLERLLSTDTRTAYRISDTPAAPPGVQRS